MKRAPAGLVFAVGFCLLSPLASAQTPPTAPSADDAAMAAQKAAFMGLPEASRKARQEALVWLGLYVGVNDGDFGKRHPRRDPCVSGEPQSARRRGAVRA